MKLDIDYESYIGHDVDMRIDGRTQCSSDIDRCMAYGTGLFINGKLIDEANVTPAQLGTEVHTLLERCQGLMPNRTVFVGDVDLQLEELEQLAGWAEKVQELSGPHKFIFVKLGEDRQPVDPMEYLGPLTADEFRRYNWVEPMKRKGINKGKGQRKANRRDRWK